MTLGESLQLMRKRNDLTQREVWQLTGIHYKTISNWENNVAKPSPDDLKTLAKLYHVSVDILLGIDPLFKPAGYYPIIEPHIDDKVGLIRMHDTKRVPVIGTVRCGVGGVAYEYVDEYITVDDTYRPDEMRGFRAEGDSMEPEIHDGDICLVHLQEEVPDGALAVVVICDGADEGEGTIKRIHKQDGAIILQATNQAYAPRIFTGENANKVRIVGRVVEVRHKTI